MGLTDRAEINITPLRYKSQGLSLNLVNKPVNFSKVRNFGKVFRLIYLLQTILQTQPLIYINNEIVAKTPCTSG